MLGSIVKRFEWPLVRKAVYKCSPFSSLLRIAETSHPTFNNELNQNIFGFD
jgi:hypothetical protein